MDALQQRFLQAILSGDLPVALATANDARTRGLTYLYEELVAGALVEVGRHWQEGRISVAEEHVATALTQSVLASFYPTFAWPSQGPRAVVACVADERHELGARMAADLLVCDGWNVTFVGADVPLDSLLALARRDRPRFVGLSAALPARVGRVREAIAGLRREVSGVRIVVGGGVVACRDAATLEPDVIARSGSEAVAAVRGWKP
jgi:methanogenic corrinoid protein MtbC1